MKLFDAFSILLRIRFVIQQALTPTLQVVLRSPSVLLNPTALSRLFMSKLWITFGADLDSNCRSAKEHLITPDAYGVVLDIGAGHGHTAAYLDKTRVTRYIALEPNIFMHTRLRESANVAGFFESDGSLLILSCGAEDTASILSSVKSANSATRDDSSSRVDTLISILTLCTVPSPKETITSLVEHVLAPGGQFLFYEHVLSPKADVAWWQHFWAPLWSVFFDGCRLGRPTHLWIEEVTDERDGGSIWAEKEIWGNEGEPDDHLFWHRIGKMVRRAD